MIDKEKLMVAATSDMLKFRDRKILLNITLPDACILVAQLQLAMRHPQNTGAPTSRAHCESIIAALAQVSPLIATMLELGFDPANDVPR